MNVYTIQVCRWKLCQSKNICFIDTTVKTGYKELAPTWDMAMSYKKGELSEDKYTELYLDILKTSYQNNPSFWADLLNSDVVALGCYCKPDNFCHRLILTDFLKQKCFEEDTDFTYLGELLK